MKQLVRFFLNHRMLVHLILLATTIIGIASTLSSRKDGFPDISLNRIIVQTIYPGASARDLEINVTLRIEEELKEVEGIKEILSYSEESISRIEIQGKENLNPEQFRTLFNDIDNAIARIEDLPRDIKGKPTVTDFTTSDMPVMEIAYTGDYTTLKPYLENLERRLGKIEGVANTDIIGLPDEEVKILVNPVQARNHSLDLRMIAGAIKKRNLEGSGGTLESFTGEKKIVFLSKFDDYHDVLQTNIIMNSEGYGVKLKDVASLDYSPEDVKLLVRNNGNRGATLSIRKTSSSDLLDTVDQINSVLTHEKLPLGVTSKILFDQSQLTRNRIQLLIGNAMMGFVLVIGILLYFFNFQTALWTAFGIPFTLLGMLIFLKSQDISLNLISLAGFIILIGMLVDDAVVIAEEYNTNRENGMEPDPAAIAAVERMWSPIVASSATTMIAFAPLFAVGGFPGKFIWTIPLMVIVGLLVSLFESFFSLPVHLTHGKLKPVTKKKLIVHVENLYEKTLHFFLNHRYKSLVFFLALLVLSMVTLKKFVKKDPFPQDAAEGFNILLTLPLGQTPLQSEKQIEKIEQLLNELPADELTGFSTRIGTKSELTYTARGTQNNLAVIFVYLTPYQNRTRKATDIMKSLAKELDAISKKDNIQYTLNLKRLGPPMGRAIEMRIIANDDNLRLAKEKEVISFLSGITGVSNVESNELEGLNELNLKINHETLSLSGLTVDDLLTTLRIAFDGLIVTEMNSIEKNIPFRVKLDYNENRDRHFINHLPIANNHGNLVNLDRFVTIQEVQARSSISHVNNFRATTIFGNVDNQIISPNDVMALLQNKFPSTQEIQMEYAGQPIETELIFRGITIAALIAVIGIYLIIALIFNSWVKPVIIMLSLPFMAIGLAFVLFTHGIPGSMMVGIAMVGLMGVIVNASIVMVDTILGMASANGLTRQTIMTGAVSRLRPILLTTITTVLGVLPTGYGIGGYDPFLSHMSLVLAYGLLFGTMIILVIVPMLFVIGLDVGKTFHVRIYSQLKNKHKNITQRWSNISVAKTFQTRNVKE